MTNFYCADIGNYSSITALQGQKPRVMRTVFQDVTYTSATDTATENSPSVKVDGKTLVLGDRATKQKKPQSAAERGKQLPEFVKPFTLAGLREDFEGDVRFLVPDVKSVWELDAIRTLLVGENEITINGKCYKHKIKSVEFYNETDLAVVHGYRTGKLDNDGDTLCIDIGGGTTNYLVMTPDEQVLVRRTIPKVGGVSLANDIINCDLMQGYARRESVAFNVAKTMDAIADGSYIYGRKYDFNSVFPGLLESWFNNLMDSITTAANDYLADVTNIMLIGGNANLVRHKLSGKPGFYIPDDPQLSNIQALLAL